MPYTLVIPFPLQDITARLEPVSPRKSRRVSHRARQDRPVSPWGLLILMTFFQILTCIQLILSTGDKAHPALPLVLFVGMTALMWVYCLTLRAFRRVGFEMEIIAFFLCTLSLAVTASFAPSSVPKQFISIVLGLIGFLILGWFLRDLRRANLLRRPMAVIAVLLRQLTLVFGSADGGAKNWITFGGMSLQPSELAKICCYIFAGAATLDRLLRKKNLGLFMALTIVWAVLH